MKETIISWVLGTMIIITVVTLILIPFTTNKVDINRTSNGTRVIKSTYNGHSYLEFTTTTRPFGVVHDPKCP